MRIAYITAGAAGTFCGSCLRDNALVAALNRLGHDAVLVPTYTPIRTDEEDVSLNRVFLGGINVYLEQKTWLFRHTPRFVDWLFNRPALLRWATKSVAQADYGELAEMTVSTLRGEHGRQRKEVRALARWLRHEFRPDVVILTNVLLSGLVPAIKAALGVPVLATLQGDDIFLDALPKAGRAACLDLIRDNDQHIDGHIATSRYYADHMADYLGIAREKVRVVPPGINLAGHGGVAPADRAGPPTVGYFARVCPEKGFQNLVEAYIRLRRSPGGPAARLRASGWLGPGHRPFFDEQVGKLRSAGLADDFEYVESPTHADKVRFLRSLDVFSVPTDYREPKGLYVLEAWANGVPVVQPRHGAFPELIEATGGGVLVPPGDPDALAAGLRDLLGDPERRQALGRQGEGAVRERFSAETMAERTLAVLNDFIRPGPRARTLRPGPREPMPTPFSITRRVEFADTDMAGIMHFANFFRFMEVAETDFMRSHGLSVTWLDPDGKRVGFPRVSASCDYARPARFGDEVTVTLTVEKVGRKSVTYRHDFTNARGELLAVGRITAVFCREAGGDYRFESVEIPPDLRAKLES